MRERSRIDGSCGTREVYYRFEEADESSSIRTEFRGSSRIKRSDAFLKEDDRRDERGQVKDYE